MCTSSISYTEFSLLHREELRSVKEVEGLFSEQSSAPLSLFSLTEGESARTFASKSAIRYDCWEVHRTKVLCQSHAVEAAAPSRSFALSEIRISVIFSQQSSYLVLCDKRLKQATFAVRISFVLKT